MEKQVKQTWHFNQAPQVVWEYLTNPELMGQWLMKCNFVPEVGHKFQFINNDKIDAYCQVLEIIPHKLLSYSWKKGKSENEIRLDSVVTWTLIDKGGKTDLLLQHGDFELLKDFDDHSNGWNYLLGHLVERLNASSDANSNV